MASGAVDLGCLKRNEAPKRLLSQNVWNYSAEAGVQSLICETACWEWTKKSGLGSVVRKEYRPTDKKPPDNRLHFQESKIDGSTELDTGQNASWG